jgi:hypothetical protein
MLEDCTNNFSGYLNFHLYRSCFTTTLCEDIDALLRTSHQIFIKLKNETKLRGFSPQANYTKYLLELKIRKGSDGAV